MCGRYYIEINDEEMKNIIMEVQNKTNAPEQMIRTGEIFPTNIAPVITSERTLPMKWGFTRFDGKGVIINARCETVAEKSMFRRALHEGRCLIPASHYFEWEKLPDGKKQKYALGTQDKLIYMAGLYRVEPGNNLPVFVIMTKGTEPGISHIHDRMPVILPRETQMSWLSGDLSILGDQIDGIRYEAVI